MKESIKKKWLEALRSGKYKQAKETLKDNSGKFCCLGVLCDIHRKTMKKSQFKWSENGQYINRKTNEKGNRVLPNFVMKWSQLKDGNPIPKGKKIV